MTGKNNSAVKYGSQVKCFATTRSAGPHGAMPYKNQLSDDDNDDNDDDDDTIGLPRACVG